MKLLEYLLMLGASVVPPGIAFFAMVMTQAKNVSGVADRLRPLMGAATIAEAQLAVLTVVLIGVVMLYMLAPQDSVTVSAPRRKGVQQICCRGSRDNIKDWFKRLQGRFAYVHVVVKINNSYRIMRQGPIGYPKFYRCHCGRWGQGWSAKQLAQNPQTHHEYNTFHQAAQQTDSQHPHEFAMDMIGAYGGTLGSYWDSRDAQAVADNLNKGIPLNWPLWAAAAFAIIQAIAIVVGAIW